MINAYDLLKELDFERLAGSPGEKRGRDVICSYLDKLNVPWEEHTFQFTGFTPGTARIKCSLGAFDAAPYGLATDAAVSGELVWAEDMNLLKYNCGAYRGKLILSNNASLALIEWLERNRIAGLITIGSPHKGAQQRSFRQKSHADGLTFPVVNLHYADAKKLLDAVGEKIELTIRQQAFKASGVNIVATIPGTAPDDNLTYAVGHYDSVAHSHGSLDNAAGCVNLVSLAEHFTKNPPKRDLRIIFFTGEEMGLLGSTAYVRDNEDEIKERGRVVVNIDLSGDVIGRNMLIVTGTQEMRGWGAASLREAGLMFSDSLDIYSSDCMPFTVHDVPSFNVARVGGEGLFWCHTAEDRARWAHPSGLEQTFLGARQILGRLLNAEIYPFINVIDGSLRKKIEEYLYNSRRAEPGLQWEPDYRKKRG